jgi:hypothetical protein
MHLWGGKVCELTSKLILNAFVPEHGVEIGNLLAGGLEHLLPEIFQFQSNRLISRKCSSFVSKILNALLWFRIHAGFSNVFLYVFSCAIAWMPQNQPQPHKM